MTNRHVALVVLFGCGFASTAVAQLGSYLGPQILTRGPGDIGTRAGETVDLRLFAGVNGVYDTGIQPVAVDSSGHLKTVNGLIGEEASLGAYGTHQYKHASLSLDYTGTFRHYQGNNSYDGSDHSLALDFSYQASARLSFDFRQIVGTSSLGSNFAAALPAAPENVVNPSSIVFDNRTTYLQSTGNATYALSARTSFTVGGNGNLIRRQSQALVGVNGYGGHASLQHSFTRRTTAGVSYDRTHYGYTGGFGQSDINIYSIFLTQAITRNWSVTGSAGVLDAAIQGQQEVLLDPAVAAVLGVSTVTQPFRQRTILPNWNVDTGRGFRGSKNIYLSFGYHRGISSGNGIYLASKMESAIANLSYTGVRKSSFSVNAQYYKLQSIGQNIQPYYQVSAGTSFTYTLTNALHLIALYNQRIYGVSSSTFNGNGYRVAVGISFSPGDIPLSFH